MNNKAPLHKEFLNAVKKGELRVVHVLLKAGVLTNVNYQDENADTALHWASWDGHTEIVKELLAHPDIDVNIQSKSGYTAIMCASAIGREEIVRLLLACPGVDVNRRDKEGKRALDKAGNEEIKTLLRAHGAAKLAAAGMHTTAPAPIAPPPAVPPAAAPLPAAAAVVPVPAPAPVAIPRSWLAERLLHSGYDVAVARDCEQILVLNEGFAREGDWLECPPTEFNRAYLTSVGITGLGLQRHIVSLHSLLRPVYMRNVSPTWKEESAQDPAPGADADV